MTVCLYFQQGSSKGWPQSCVPKTQVLIGGVYCYDSVEDRWLFSWKAGNLHFPKFRRDCI